MKYGRLVYRYTGHTYIEKGAIYNIGDNMQTFAVDNLYRRMGISAENIVDINFSEMQFYDGEEVILPMAGYGSHYKRFHQFPTSDKIIPFFIGFEMSDPACDDIIPYLKKYEPIGCRDEATMQLLLDKGVSAYVSGCLTITFPRRLQEPKEPKVFFVDISSKLEKYIPNRLRRNCEYIEHEGELKSVPMTEEERQEIEVLSRNTLERYRKEAGLVVTSRLHAAAPCVALGIPVILAIDNIDKRFSWLDKLIPIYDSRHYGDIDWEVKACDCEEIKEWLFHIFESNINALRSRITMHKVSEYWRNRIKSDYDAVLWSKLGGLQEQFTLNDEFTYLIWGAGVHGKLAYALMREKFPKAKMVACIDKYAEGDFFGVKICKPQDVYKYSFNYALITTHLGRFEAVQALNQMGMEWWRNYCYFISKNVPEEKWLLEHKDEIVLYGYNEYCKKQADKLVAEGYNVAGIIDQNYSGGGIME